MRGGIPRQCGDRFTKFSRLDVIQERGQTVFLLARQHKIVAFFKERDEIEIMLERRGLQSQRGISAATGDGLRTLGRCVDNDLVTVDFVRRDAQPLEFNVQPETGSGAGIAVDKTETGLGQV